VKCVLTCGRCGARWRFESHDPYAGLLAHRREKHADDNLGPSPLDVLEREPGSDDGDAEAQP
jgi:hypothetical protein